MQDGANTLRSLTLFVSSHFMFNVLGKLQSEILSGEKREAISTLTLYSRILRQASNFSAKDSVSFLEEGSFLDNYLKLEQGRFNETPFKYYIDGFDSETLLIEPFLIQPFVELAVLGSLGTENNLINIEFDNTQHTICIDSVMLNTEIRSKLAEKCEVTKQRLEYFNHAYSVSETGQKFSQKIILNKQTR